MSDLRRPWLEPYPWEKVILLNEQLCKSGKVEHGKTPGGHEIARESWDKSFDHAISFEEAIEQCRQAHENTPFLFFNGNTFGAIARRISQDLIGNLSQTTQKIFTAAVGHYVAGTLPKKDFDSIFKRTSELLQQNRPSL